MEDFTRENMNQNSIEQNSTGRLAYLFDWLNPDKWFPSEIEKYPTRVIKKLTYDEDEKDEIIKVIINPSIKYESRWAPIIEVNKVRIYLDQSNKGPQLPWEWYKSQNLARMAAFEFLWPTSADNWDGTWKYFEDMEYLDYYKWRYGHPSPRKIEDNNVKALI